MDEIKESTFHKIIERVRTFFEGRWFPIALGGVALLFYALNLPVVGLAICLLCAAFVFLFSEDTRPAVPVVFLLVVTLRYKDNMGAYLTTAAFCVYAVVLPILLFSLVYRLVKFRVEWKSKTGLLSIALLCVAFLLGGLFSVYYDLKNFAYAIGFSSIAFGIYAFFAFTLKKREDNFVYLARVCAVVVCVIALEVVEFYIRCYRLGMPMDNDWKLQIVLGWSISNMVAEMMVFLLPAVFYLMYREKNGWLYWLVVGVAFIGIFLTLCRNALLWGGICIATCAVINCIVGKNKTVNRILVAVAAVGAIILLVVLMQWKGFSTVTAFFKQMKLTDNGRFGVWAKHGEFFLRSPINGVGFQAYRQIPRVHATYAHNSLIQMAASTGIVGLGLYLIHRLQTIYLIVKEPRAERFFFGGCILLGVLISLLSPLFFLPYFTIYYAVILLFLEKSCKDVA